MPLRLRHRHLQLRTHIAVSTVAMYAVGKKLQSERLFSERGTHSQTVQLRQMSTKYSGGGSAEENIHIFLHNTKMQRHLVRLCNIAVVAHFQGHRGSAVHKNKPDKRSKTKNKQDAKLAHVKQKHTTALTPKKSERNTRLHNIHCNGK